MLNLKFPRFWNQLVKILERKQKLKKKTFFDELLQQKQKQSRHKKVDLTFQKKFQNFLKNRSDFGVKKFIYFIYFYFSAQSRKRALLHLRWSRFSGQERKWWGRFLISWNRSYKKFRRRFTLRWNSRLLIGYWLKMVTDFNEPMRT